ncbi:MAG: hypothetical protein HRT54_07430 [Colwellia sp.]|nr:hypothetical protein [Colwellia sp.]
MTDFAYYDFIMQLTAGVCITLIIIAVLFFINRSKIAKQRTIQSLVETGKDITPELLESLGLKVKKLPQNDFRKGILLFVTGMVLTLIFKMMGGFAWMFGLLPIILGIVYVVFSRLNSAKI